jgi:hypothetical protein
VTTLRVLPLLWPSPSPVCSGELGIALLLAGLLVLVPTVAALASRNGDHG